MLEKITYLKLLHFIIDNASCAMILIDKNEIVLMTNREHEKLTGYSSKFLVGMSLNEMIDRKIIHDAVSRKVVEQRRPVVLEQQSFSRTGEEFFVMVKGVPFFNASDEIEYVICYLFDISDKRRLIEDLSSSNLKYGMELFQFKNSDSNIVFRSPLMQNIIDKAKIISKTDSTALILGESGVGKSLIAKFMHDNSARKDNTFLTINCGAVPDSLIESELFGYEKGAFTGAQSNGKKGLVELADKGTLFLDEIGDMPYELQVKLLRLLQEKEFFRVGGSTPIKIDTRIIAATNRNLKELVEEKKFREDLYYRLNVLSLHIPPLRERPEDIPLLTETFRLRFNDHYRLQKTFSSELITQISRLPLHGNVRELQNLIERLMLFSEKRSLTVNELYEILEPEPSEEEYDIHLGNRTYKQLKDDFEKKLLTAAKKKYKTTVAIGKHLDMDQSTISRKLKRLSIK